MRALQKLTRNGSSTCVVIARPILIALGWLPGQAVIVDVLEDKTLRVRLPEVADLSPIRASRFVLEPMTPVKP
jgi:hypothetical protein